MHKTILSILVVVALVAGGYYFFGPERPDTGNGTGNGDQTVAPADWQMYTNETAGVTMQVPPDAQTKTERDLAKVQLIGPDNEPNTEITDGVTFYAGQRNLSDGMTLAELAQREYEEATEIGESVREPAATTTPDGREAYTYAVRGPIGAETVYTLIRADADAVLYTSAIVSDPQNRGYRDTVDTIMQTLKTAPITAQGVPIEVQQRFDQKIVYTTDVGSDTDAYTAHCEATGGNFNECGSVCGPDADACVEVCALTCEFSSQE